jgi:hypothetical protein
MAEHVSRMQIWAARIDRMPRGVRVVLSLITTLELVVLAWVVMSELFGVDLFDSDPDLLVPLLIVLGLGLVFYGIGWWAMVGFDLDPALPWRAGRPAVLYLAAGIGALVLLIMLALFGLAFGYIL